MPHAHEGDGAQAANTPLTLDAMLGMQGASEPQGTEAQQAQLSRLVELEIIPRLMLMHRVQPLRPRPVAPAVDIGTADVQALSELAVHGSPDGVQARVEALIEQGASHEQIFLDLLAPCARHMGDLWDDDVYSFSQVTIGLWRLQRVLHELAAPAAPLARGDAHGQRVLMAAVPGSQHTFGVTMVAEFFSRAGWDVVCEPRASWQDLRSRSSREWFDVFGLSVSASDSLALVASAILDIRRAAANPQLFVMVGGPLAASMPDLARRCGADAMASDAPSAVAAACGSLRRSAKSA
ncbi:MAG: cobalamin B12-binding domain-containing protein [Burkholderiales bacterium]|nr:MAG: cobalamin B12-binding domain-containing protein [Burkholderiales bacterium]